jgi:hypothetical protein
LYIHKEESYQSGLTKNTANMPNMRDSHQSITPQTLAPPMCIMGLLVDDGVGNAPKTLYMISPNPSVLVGWATVKASVLPPITRSTPVPTGSSDTAVPSTVMAAPPTVRVCDPITYAPAELRDTICPSTVAIAGLAVEGTGS